MKKYWCLALYETIFPPERNCHSVTLSKKLFRYTHIYVLFFTTNLKLEQIWLRAHISILACYAMINFEAFKIHEVSESHWVCKSATSAPSRPPFFKEFGVKCRDSCDAHYTKDYMMGINLKTDISDMLLVSDSLRYADAVLTLALAVCRQIHMPTL